MGDARIQQNAVDAQVHGHSYVAGRAHASVDDHRIVRVAILEILQADADSVGIKHALAGPIGLPAGMTLGPPPPSVGVQRPRRRSCRPAPGSRRPRVVRWPPAWPGGRAASLGVAQHFQLHPVGTRIVHLREDFASQPGHAHGVGGREATGRVGQDRIAARYR